MERHGWMRVFVCGLVAGGVWTLLSVILLAAVGDAFMSSVRGVRPSAPRGGVPFALIANLAAGVWAMWLYAAIRARYGPGPRTAAVAGCAWWFLQSLQSAKWLELIGVASGASLAALAAATLPAMIVAVLAGAWAYEH
jgi:hypothetical protein